MEWQEEYSVGDQSMDADHLIIFNLINEFQFSNESELDRMHAAFIISELEAYSRHHFAREENFMKRIDYPNLAHHKRKHTELLSTLGNLREQYADGQTHDFTEVSIFLSDWWEKHILIEDMMYKGFQDKAPTGTAPRDTVLISG